MLKQYRLFFNSVLPVQLMYIKTFFVPQYSPAAVDV